MEERAKTIQMVINTLETLDIKATAFNMETLLGCMQTLARLRDELMEEKQDEDHAD